MPCFILCLVLEFTERLSVLINFITSFVYFLPVRFIKYKLPVVRLNVRRLSRGDNLYLQRSHFCEYMHVSNLNDHNMKIVLLRKVWTAFCGASFWSFEAYFVYKACFYFVFSFKQKTYEFYKRSGLTSLPTFLLNGVILKDITDNTMEEVIVSEVLQATPTFQRAVYHVSGYDRNQHKKPCSCWLTTFEILASEKYKLFSFTGIFNLATMVSLLQKKCKNEVKLVTLNTSNPK